MTDESTEQNVGEFLIGARIVPDGREGNVQYVRTLRRGEKDTGEVVNVEAGFQLAFRKGALEIDIRDIDEYYNPKMAGGFRPVTNTVWGWLRFVPVERGGFSYYLFVSAFARRLDATHDFWATTIEV